MGGGGEEGRLAFLCLKWNSLQNARKAEDILIIVSQLIIYFVVDCRFRYETHLDINHYIVGGI